MLSALLATLALTVPTASACYGSCGTQDAFLQPAYPLYQTQNRSGRPVVRRPVRRRARGGYAAGRTAGFRGTGNQYVGPAYPVDRCSYSLTDGEDVVYCDGIAFPRGQNIAGLPGDTPGGASAGSRGSPFSPAPSSAYDGRVSYGSRGRFSSSAAVSSDAARHRLWTGVDRRRRARQGRNVPGSPGPGRGRSPVAQPVRQGGGGRSAGGIRLSVTCGASRQPADGGVFGPIPCTWYPGVFGPVPEY